MMSPKLPFERKLLFIVMMITFIKFHLHGVVETAGGVVTNKMRYATSEKLNENKLTEQAIEYAASEMRTVEKPLKSEESYRINENLYNKNKYHQGRLLDEEDRSLLEEFYRETKDRDPFDKESISSIENLWDDRETNSMNSLIDIEQVKSPTFKHRTNVKSEVFNDGWTIDSDYLAPLNGLRETNDNNKEITSTSSNNLANYSPTLRLLTTYNPLEKAKILSDSSSGEIVGATLYGQDKTTMPKVYSKSATNAIKLHDDLMREPPKDGKVRVRMYYHRAIHDDARLYGNGPWKYWGHGWGVEFGYDPKKADNNNDFYQKGYTIERAFGRDFCKDKLNCRQPDPDFFKDPHKVGHYSKQYYNAKLLPKKSNDYKIRQY